jgi:hypothetical protein
LVARDQRVRAGLVERDLAALEGGDAIDVDVGAGDVVSVVGEAGPHDEADVAGADDRELHGGTVADGVDAAVAATGRDAIEAATSSRWLRHAAAAER